MVARSSSVPEGERVVAAHIPEPFRRITDERRSLASADRKDLRLPHSAGSQLRQHLEGRRGMLLKDSPGAAWLEAT
jgi:hypothetical protein